MTTAQFYNIVDRVTPAVQRVNTNFGAAITAGERLAVTLLATGTWLLLLFTGYYIFRPCP